MEGNNENNLQYAKSITFDRKKKSTPLSTARPGPCDGSLYAPRGPLPAGMRRKTNRPKPGPLEPPKGRYLGYGVNIYCMRPDRHSFSKGGSFSAWGESICPGNFFWGICGAFFAFFLFLMNKRTKNVSKIYILTSSVAGSFFLKGFSARQRTK